MLKNKNASKNMHRYIILNQATQHQAILGSIIILKANHLEIFTKTKNI